MPKKSRRANRIKCKSSSTKEERAIQRQLKRQEEEQNFYKGIISNNTKKRLEQTRLRGLGRSYLKNAKYTLPTNITEYLPVAGHNNYEDYANQLLFNYSREEDLERIFNKNNQEE